MDAPFAASRLGFQLCPQECDVCDEAWQKPLEQARHLQDFCHTSRRGPGAARNATPLRRPGLGRSSAATFTTRS